MHARVAHLETLIAGLQAERAALQQLLDELEVLPHLGGAPPPPPRMGPSWAPPPAGVAERAESGWSEAPRIGYRIGGGNHLGPW